MKCEMYIGSNCAGGSCPTIYRSDRGTFVIQGALVNPGEVNDLAIPSHEGVVEVPESLIQALIAKAASE